jgi:hypothetical protein
MLIAPITEASIGMGNDIIITAFVVIIVGGIGSMKGAFIAALVIGLIDTMGRSFLVDLFKLVMPVNAAETAAPAISAMLIYLLMAAILASGRRACSRLRCADMAQSQHSRLVLTVARPGPGQLAGARVGHGPPAGSHARRAAFGLVVGTEVLPRSVDAHGGADARRGQPQPRAGLRRHDLLRPCRLCRHRRLQHVASWRITGSVPAWCTSPWLSP